MVFRRALLGAAAVILALQLYGLARWIDDAGGLGQAVSRSWHLLRSDAMLQVVVADLLLIAAAVLVALWRDASRRSWTVANRLLLVLAFTVLGSPVLLAYLAARPGPAVRPPAPQHPVHDRL